MYLSASEAQLGLLLGGGNILFCKGLGGLRGGSPPPLSKIFQKQKCFFKGFLSRKKGKKKVVACIFGCVQFKSIFCSCVLTKFILPTAIK